MDYAGAMQYIEGKGKLGQRPGLDSIKELLLRLGNPQDKIKCLHIAGTNGKGSIFSFLQDVLLEAGYSVGRYISPTVFSYLERFQIDKEEMDEAMFAGLLERVRKAEKAMISEGYPEPTAFETETAVAFLYFYTMKVDYALIECGMGGRLDGTNVMKHPDISVIAQISRDHMQFLGNTLTDIASEKAGIIKENSICVSAPQTNEAAEVLMKSCLNNRTDMYMVRQDDISVYNMDIMGSTFSYKGEAYTISLPGEYQVINAATAIEAAYHIPNVSTDIIKSAIKKTRWPGRFTVVGKHPYIIVDGAHNEQAWILLKKSLHKYFTNKKIIYIIGVLRDKEYERMVDILCDTMKRAITVTPDNPRGLNKDILAALIKARGVDVCTADGHDMAMQLALEGAACDDVIVVCGSLSFIADYMR